MARHAPGPTVIRVQNVTAFGFHTKEYHTRVWTPVSTGHDLGQVPRWSDDALIDVETMLTALLTLELEFMPASGSYTLATVFTQATPTSSLVPQASKALTGLVGTAATPGWDKAVQQTIVVRTLDNNIAKIVQLDAASFNSFDAVRVPGAAPDIDAIVAEFTDDAKAWSGGDDSRPVTFIGSFKTINEKLRKAYRMT